MVGADFDQAHYYIKLLRGDGNQPVHWQMFNDKDSESGSPQVFYSSLNDAKSTIEKYQRQGFGAYVTINPTDGKGRKRENIIGYKWLFADIDGNKQVLIDYPLKPAFITSRDGTHGHVYWPITGITTEKQYNRAQRLISMYLDCDEQVIDPCRVARCPGTLHLKDPSNPASYKVVQDNSDTVDFEYDYEEVLEAFKLDEEKQKILEKFLANREAYTSGSGLNDNPIYREQLVNFAKFNAVPAVEGSGSKELFRVAGFGYDRGISLEETTDILWEHYNPRCEPPWTENQRHQFELYCYNAYEYSKNAFGCKTATGLDWGEVVEPAGGWEKNAAIATENAKTGQYDKDVPEMVYEHIEGDMAFITPSEAAANNALVTSKSTIYEQGLKFIGETYPNKTLLRYESIFYAYTGTHWIELSDEFIMAQLMRFFACWMFPPSKIKNLFDTIKMQVFEDKLKRGVYLDNKDKDIVTSVIVKNGVIDIADGKASLKPHDRNFFDLNVLPFDYDPNAKCPEFLKFVDQQWPGDKEMLNQLQEMYGLCLMPVKQVQMFALMIGKSRAGKGVHKEIISTMIGKHNITSPNLESLIEDHTINSMSQSKVAIVPEANAINKMIKDRVLNRLKAVVGGDAVHFNRKYKDSAECDVWPFMIIQSNEFPDFADSSGALANRVWPFVLTRSFAGKEDKGLVARLCKPESISGIFNWALEGLVRVLNNNMNVTISKGSREYIEDIRYDTFPLAAFVEEVCIIDPSAITYSDELYEVYLIHSREKGVKMPLSVQRFNKMLDSSHLPVTRTRESKPTDGKRKYYFKGLGINDIAKAKNKGNFPPVAPPENINKKIK